VLTCRLLENNALLTPLGSDNRWEPFPRKVRAYNRAVDSEEKDSLQDKAVETPYQNGGGARALPVGRVLGLDVGSRRIGVAVSDPLGITAQGLDTLQRTTKRRDFEQLQRVIQEYDVREIVVGLPLRMSGGDSVGQDAGVRGGIAEEVSAAGASVG
jgi:hypothetical protein